MKQTKQNVIFGVVIGLGLLTGLIYLIHKVLGKSYIGTDVILDEEV